MDHDPGDKKDFKQNLSGYLYQVKILMLFSWRGKNFKKFQLGTELCDAEKFDDVVFSYEKDGENFIRYVQAKYSHSDGAELTYSDFVTDYDRAKCNLKKYFISYKKIKQRTDVKKIADLILCTNITFPVPVANSTIVILTKNASNNLKFLDVSNNFKDEFFYDSKTKKEWKKFQLQDVKSCKELDEKLHACSNLNLLASELAIYLFKDTDDANLDFKNYWISAYFNALMKEKVVIDRVYRFAAGNQNPQQIERNKAIKELKTHFIDQMKKQKGKILTAEDLNNIKFEKCFIDNLNIRKRTDTKKNDFSNVPSQAEIDRKLKDVSTDIKQLAEALVKNDPTEKILFDKLNDVFALKNEYVFSDNFVYNNSDLNENAKLFRSILLKHCEKHILKSIQKQEFVTNNDPRALYENNAEFGESTMKEETKKLVDHIFYKKDLSDVCESKYLKNVLVSTGKNTYKFTKDYTTDPEHQIFREIFTGIYFEEMLKKHVIKFKQNFSKQKCFKELIKEFKAAFMSLLQNTVTDDIEKKETSENETCQSIVEKNDKHNKPGVIKIEKTILEKCNGLLEALNGSIFVSSEKRNRIKFTSEFFNSDESHLNRVAQEFKKEFKKEFQKELSKAELELLKNFEIEYANYPPYFDRLEEYGDLNDEIEEFRKLLFVVNTPNEIKLMENIAFELGKKFNLLDSEMITNKLFQEILNFSKQNEECFITSDSIMATLEKLKVTISKKLALGCTVEYCHKLEEYGVEYIENLSELFTFLNSTNSRIFHLTTNEILLTAIKVAQTLKSTKFWKQRDSIIFNPLTSLLRMENALENGNEERHVSKTFDSIANLLIIVDDQGTQKDIDPFGDRLYQIFCENAVKKIVIIGNKTSPIALALMNDQTKHLYYDFIDKTKFDDLTQDSQSLIIKEKKVIFQGNSVSLNNIIDTIEDAVELIDSETLQKLIKGDEIIIGKPVIGFTELEQSYYYKRKFRINEIDSKVFEESFDNHIFAIEGTNVSEFLKSKNIGEIKILHACDVTVSSQYHQFIILEEGDAELQYTEICKKCPGNFIHWLKLDDNTLVYFSTYIPISKKLPLEFVKHIQRNRKYVDESDFYKYVKENQVVIIADKAGMGKTTVLNSFSKTLIDLNYWKLQINLNQYTETLLEINKCFKYNLSVENISENTFKLCLNSVDFKSKDYGKLVLKSLINNEILDFKKLKFEDRIFNHFFTKNKMLFIFDGFDEINPDYGNEVILLIRKLAQNENNRIWITSRTNFKETLEKELNTFAYEMEPFDEYDQYVFFKKFWLNNWKIQKNFDMPNQDRLSVYTEILIDEASEIIGDIIGIPLQTKMLAEIFQENHDEQKTWTSCFEYVENVFIQENMLNISAKIGNTFLLYESFFEEKVFKYFLQDKQGMDWSKPFMKDFKNVCLSNSKRLHKLYGFIALCDNKAFAKNLFTEEDLQPNSREEIVKIGIIDSFNADNIPLFTHLTYAEYFCASFLVDKLWNSPAYSVFQVINEILKKDVAVFVKCLLYKLKHESDSKKLEEILNGKSILKYVIHHQFLNCVKLFLSSKDFNDCIYFKTKHRKDIIRYAAEFGNKEIFFHIVVFICQKYRSIDFFHHLRSYIIGLNRNFIKCETINLFLKDIKAAKNQPKIIKDKKENYFNQYSELNARYIIQILEHLFKHLSFESIFNLVKMFRHHFDKYPKFSILVEICIRNDITIKEKIKICKLICDNKEKDDHVIAMYKTCVKYDCHDLLKEMLNDYEFKITNTNIISLIKTGVQCNMHEITIILFEKLKIDNPSEMDYLIKCIFLTETNLELLKQITEKTKLPLNKALLIAIKNNCNVKIIKFLIENGAKPDIIDAEEESAWTLTVKKNDDDKILKIFFDNFNSLGSKNMKTTVREYFEKFVITNDESRLIQATEDRDNLLCHFLLRRSTNPKLILFRLAYYDEIDNLTNQTFDVKELIGKYKNIKEHTLWHVATKCKSDNIGIWKSIINKQDSNGNTALHFAVQHSVSFSAQLLGSEVCYNIKNNDGKVPADLISGDPQLTKFFMEIASAFNVAEKNDFDFINDYDRDIINVKNEKGNTFLHYAVMKKNNEAVSDLLFQDADITIKNNKKRTPLFYAVKNNVYDMVTNIIQIIGDPMLFEPKFIFHNLTIFDEETYTDVPKNKCTNLLQRIKKCLDHFNNEETEALINNLEFFGDNKVFNGIVNLCGFFGNNYAITKYLLQKGFKIFNISYVCNQRITKAIDILNEMVYIVKSKEYEPESIVNYYENNVKHTLCYLLYIDEKNFTNKIMANVRFEAYKGSVIGNDDTLLICGGTLLHLTAARNEEKLVEWLLKIGANPYSKDYDGNDVYEIANKCKSQKVLQILPAEKKI